MDGMTVIGHMGTGETGSSYVGYDAERGTAVAVTTNTAIAGPSAIMARDQLRIGLAATLLPRACVTRSTLASACAVKRGIHFPTGKNVRRHRKQQSSRRQVVWTTNHVTTPATMKTAPTAVTSVDSKWIFLCWLLTATSS